MIGAELRRRLETVATVSSLLVASDYDGVLSPIVADPASATPDQLALGALVRLGLMQDTHAAAISGRSRATLVELTGDPEGLTMIGTHGAETVKGLDDSETSKRVHALQADLLALARQYPGSEVETKPIGAAFHYRNAPQGERGAAQAQGIARAAGAKVIAGKKVIECLFGDASKGSALEALRLELGVDAVVFVGDDTTDEDAFAVLGPADVSVKVGPGQTLAQHRVPSQEDVADLFGALESARLLR